MPTTPPTGLDVVVAGAGPAGLSAAAACAAAGLRTALVAPVLRPWPATYCLWDDELAAAAPPLGLDPAAVAAAGAPTVVRTAAGGERRLTRRYARLRNDVLHSALLDRFRDSGGEVVAGRVRGLRADGGPEVAELDDGTALRARVVLDARGGGPGTAAQRAWGEVVPGPVDELVPAGGALLMDWAALADPVAPPAFLYGLSLDDGSVLLEATSLAGRPPVPLADLRARLDRVLTARGLRPVGGPERVTIPLGVPSSPGTPLGARAGLVHPATGYSVASSLRLGPRVAAALAAGGDARAVRRVVRAARPGATVALLGLGLEVLLSLDGPGTDAFFAAFFTLPERSWAAYLDVGSPPSAVAATMARTFAALPPAQRTHLLRTVARSTGTTAAGRLRRSSARGGV
ncbi:lycopene cyclase family protein [Geodermatophilus sp. DSM 44513]|uniref:lycopene cyclase family protein n=1 Tax=Geodermatophilus sp. DSM 44513 TaxID=1528104 RepID=UPI0012731958|nr:lycopene cyclase family protein [Geodermatophilus sp. DSM 44513]WNV77144.1 lycopene cyclase family protein [Geodermatophilus sp. DSM 44513]